MTPEQLEGRLQRLEHLMGAVLMQVMEQRAQTQAVLESLRHLLRTHPHLPDDWEQFLADSQQQHLREIVQHLQTLDATAYESLLRYIDPGKS